MVSFPPKREFRDSKAGFRDFDVSSAERQTGNDKINFSEWANVYSAQCEKGRRFES